jgi:hypothetical protein
MSISTLASVAAPRSMSWCSRTTGPTGPLAPHAIVDIAAMIAAAPSRLGLSASCGGAPISIVISSLDVGEWS